MVESIAELRRKLQEPVRPYNDIAGVVVGDWVSLPITRAFLKLGLSPTVGTIGMLVCGLIGSLLIPVSDVAAVAGFALVFLYYVLDCVDGEVARYHGREKLLWAFHEFFFHLIVKSAFFLSLGYTAMRTTGEPLAFALGISALLATLFMKFLRDSPLSITCRSTLLRSPSESHWVTRQLEPDLSVDAPKAELEKTNFVPYPSFGGPLATVRAMVLNFDLSLLYFLAASLIDVGVGTFQVFGLEVNAKIALLAFYAVALPLHFVDHYWTYVRDERFLRECRELLSRSHHFDADR